jgi:radical SAM protein with 4Fe4S-binding SPASM domain
MQRPRKFMDFDLFRKILTECGRKKAKKILPFLHGESLLVPGVVDYFRVARRLSPESHVNLTSNGSRLTQELTEVFLREGLIDSLIVSIDGGDKETFESIRLGLNYDEVRQNVLHFIRRRNQMGLKVPTVSIAMVTVEENRESQRKLEEEWQGADEIRNSVYFNWGGKLENDPRLQNKINYCERIYNYITILADGRVAMCCFDSEAEYAVGDVSQQSIEQIWNSKEFNKKRSLLYDKDFEELKICGKCDYLNHPVWMTPLLRFRPQIESRFPRTAAIAGNLYKKWLTN